MKARFLSIAFVSTLISVNLSNLAFSAEHAVTISNFAFSPATIEVAVGDTVVFTNEDSAPHTATSNIFDTETLNSGESKSIIIEVAGETEYKCNFHSSMTGNIIAK